MKKEDQKLLHVLKGYRKEGIELCLNGESASPKAIVKASRVAEDHAAYTLMADPVYNEEGIIYMINYDRVKLPE